MILLLEGAGTNFIILTLTALYAYHETSLASRVVAYSIFTTAICKNASVFPRCIISTIINPELYRFDKFFCFFF